MIWSNKLKKDDQMQQTRFQIGDNEQQYQVIDLVDEDIQKQPTLYNIQLRQVKSNQNYRRSMITKNKSKPISSYNHYRQSLQEERKLLQTKSAKMESKIPYPNTKQTTITYKLFNETKHRRISDQMLTKKLIKDYNIFNLSSIRKQQSERSQIDQKSYNQDNQDNQQKFVKRRRRYFDNENNIDCQRRQIRCYNCGKQGHKSSNCMSQKKKSKCYYCLDEHHCNKCTQIVCGKCGEKGHSFNECNVEKMNLKCHRCNKMGHYASNCGVVILSSFRKTNKQKQSKQPQLQLANIRCLRNCENPYGHYDCLPKKQDIQYDTSQTEGQILNSPNYYTQNVN